MVTDRRRSDRVMLTVPLRVTGNDEHDLPFDCKAHTISLNRHGARMFIAKGLHGGQVVTVENLTNRRQATFRVAGPVVPVTDRGGEYGVLGPVVVPNGNLSEIGLECLDPKIDVWGIHFPPPNPSEEIDSKALLACHICNAVELVPLALVEVDVLETSGILTRHCEKCGETGPWGYAASELSPEVIPDSPNPTAASAAGTGADPAERRRHRRAVLQLPIRIRDYFGGVEITRSENVSKSGICFGTEKNYHPGEGVFVACPYDKRSQIIEVQALIVSRRQVSKSNRKIYGVRYRPIH
ncbi:MAG TPA: PilZ domain-containing protein [Terriglobia bacterium]|nr:PilZ domain-containing protein [Terriglobia bacterium]